MNNKQVERIIALYIATGKIYAVVLIAIILFVGGMVAAEASNSAPKDGVCEYMVIQDGEILSLEVFECSSSD